MRILVTGYEAAPFYKRGGLGDVMESLPKALAEIGVDVKVVIPYYDDIRKKYHFEKEGSFSVSFDNQKENIGVFSTKITVNHSKKPVTFSFYFLENRNYLSLSKRKDKGKRMGQFALFDLAVVGFTTWLKEHHKWSVNIIHCNDWHTALIPLVLNSVGLKIPTILTIHNLLYQGVSSLKVLDFLGIKEKNAKTLRKGIHASEMNVLGEGIIHATGVSTVSPTYANEIKQNQHNHNPISSFLRERERMSLGKQGRIIGILNGIDYDIWNPASDDLIYHKFDENNWEVGKRDNKSDLLKAFNLEDKPTFCFVGRMAAQKGLDTLIKTLPRISNLDINLIILGSGDKRIEKSVINAAKKFPWVKAEVAYSEELAHKIYAASDFIVVPSKYEPCGLIQMIGMKYGTLPIASKTGGLIDSILDGKNGFLFKRNKSIDLKNTIKHALHVMKNEERYKKMVHRAMTKDFSWKKSAKQYVKVYRDLVSAA